MNLWKGTRSLRFILAEFSDYSQLPNWGLRVEGRIMNLTAYVKTISNGEANLAVNVGGPVHMGARGDYTGMKPAMEHAVRASAAEHMSGERFVCVIFNQPGTGGFCCWDSYPPGFFHEGSEIRGAGYVLRDTPLGVFAMDCLDSLVRFDGKLREEKAADLSRGA